MKMPGIPCSVIQSHNMMSFLREGKVATWSVAKANV